MSAKVFALAPPESGWERAWGRLAGAGILTLPDAPAGRWDARGPDGVSFGAEVSRGSNYRAYRYANPDLAKCAEAGRMLEIGRVISEEFGLGEFEINY